jgi:hypothetical protein
MMAINSPVKIEVDKRYLLQSIGYNDQCSPPPRTMSLIEDYVEKAHQLIDVSHAFIVKDIEGVWGNSVFIEDFIVFESTVIAQLLRHCSGVAVFVATIGDRLEGMVSELSDDAFTLKATLLDAIGSHAVECVVGLVENTVAEMAASQGLVSSRRFSPGYCDWQIGEQRAVFKAMNGASPRVVLTDDCLMLPRKSISGIIGLGSRNDAIDTYNPCISCDKKDCVGRR